MSLMRDSVVIGYKRNKKSPPKQKSTSEKNDEKDNEKDEDEEPYGEDTEVIPFSKFCYAILTGQVWMNFFNLE